ncbi:hypothetical protein Dimus_038617 [Dionaea muscipula]
MESEDENLPKLESSSNRRNVVNLAGIHPSRRSPSLSLPRVGLAVARLPSSRHHLTVDGPRRSSPARRLSPSPPAEKQREGGMGNGYREGQRERRKRKKRKGKGRKKKRKKKVGGGNRAHTLTLKTHDKYSEKFKRKFSKSRK